MTEQLAAAPVPGTPTPPPAAAITPGAEAPITTPAQASAKMDALQADPAWRDAFLSGSPVHMAQYRDLNEKRTQTIAGNETEAALAGRLEPGFQPQGRLENIAIVNMMRELGIRDEVIRECLDNKPVTQAEADLAKQWKALHFGDREWGAKLTSGDTLAQRDRVLADFILLRPIIGKENAA